MATKNVCSLVGALFTVNKNPDPVSHFAPWNVSFTLILIYYEGTCSDPPVTRGKEKKSKNIWMVKKSTSPQHFFRDDV